MGYAHTLIVGNATNQVVSSVGSARWVSVMVTCDLGKVRDSPFDAYVQHQRSDAPKVPRWFIYPPCGDGNTHALTDPYGEPFLELDLDGTVGALTATIDTGASDALRPFVDLLASFQRHRHLWRDLLVLHWGN